MMSTVDIIICEKNKRTRRKKRSGMSIPSVLFEAPKVHVFSLPPTDFLKSAAWDGHHIWTGKLKFVRDGSAFYVRLYERGDSNELFGECPVRDSSSSSPASSSGGGGNTSESVQPATDSTRAFVLRVEDGSKFSYVGLMFDDRSVAYNFSSTLIHRRRGQGPAPILPVQDRTLDSGEAITIDLFNKVKLGGNAGNRGDAMDGGSPAVASSVASSSHLLQSGPGEVPRVALDRLEVSTSGKSRRIKVDPTSTGGAAQEPSSSQTAAAASAGSADAAGAKGKGLDDIFTSPAKAGAAAGAPRNPTSIDDVFGGSSSPATVAAAVGPSSKAQKDVLDSLFG